MRDFSEFSIFGRKPEKKADRPQPDAVEAGSCEGAEKRMPAASLPAAADTVSSMSPTQNDTEAEAGSSAGTDAISVEQLTMEQLEVLFPSKNQEANAAVSSAAEAAQSGASESSREDRRARRRALISAPVRVRSVDMTRSALDDVTTTLNVSRVGILLASSDPSYYRSMDVMVTFPHSKAPNAIHTEQPGRVVRISELPDGLRSIAIALGVTHRDEEFILSNGATVHTHSQTAKIKVERDPDSSRPLVLALDAEAAIRESLKSYLANEGYDVIAVTSAQEAREVLDQCTPALLIAEIEGEGMPGYDICAHCKSTPRLQRIPVMLTTSSAYPSDYASAHSLGAVVCMAKPYRQERLGHVVKLLAPPPNANENCEPPRPADPSRRHSANGKPAKALSSNVNRRFRFGRKS